MQLRVYWVCVSLQNINTYMYVCLFHELYIAFSQTKLANNINPKTGEPFGEDFLESGVLDLEGKETKYI